MLKQSNILQKYLTSSALWSPANIFYSEQLAHSSFLFWLVEIAEPTSIVQLGANHPTHYDAYCYAVKTLSYATHCHLIDFSSQHMKTTFDDDMGFGGWGLLPASKEEYQSFSSILHLSFESAKTYFGNKSIDILHLSNPLPSMSIETFISDWKEKLSDRAIILIDSIHQFHGGADMSKEWNKIKDSYPTFSLLSAGGLGMIALGDHLPTLLKEFLNDVQDTHTNVYLRNTFSDLGLKLKNQFKDNNSLQERENKKLSKELQAVYASKSWKLTKPLRWLIATKKQFKSMSLLKKKFKKSSVADVTLPDLQDLGHWKANAEFAVILHIYYPDLWNELRLALINLPKPFDLFISLVNDKSEYLANIIQSEYPEAVIKIFPNHGRDVFPFIHFLNTGIFSQYRALLKLHTKRTPHVNYGDLWRRRTFFSLTESKRLVEQIINLLRTDPSIGIICAPNAICDETVWHDNKNRTIELAKRIHCRFSPNNVHFTASTMFWIHPELLDILKSLNLSSNDFEIEQGQLNGTTAHAIERLIGILCESSGMKIIEVSKIL